MKMFSTFIKFHAACQVIWDQAQRKKNNKIFFLFIFGVRYGDFGAVLVEMRNFSFFLYYVHVAYIERRRSVTVDEGKEKEKKKKKERKRTFFFFFFFRVERRPRVKLVSVDVAPSTGEQHASPVPLDYLLKKIYFLMFKNF